MKKIVLIIVIILSVFTQKSKAQGTNDTLAILQNIVANQSNYAGQPFSVLLSQLPIQIKYFLPVPTSSNRYRERATPFSFYFPENADQTYRAYPKLMVYWQQPLNQQQSISLWRQTNGAWSKTLASYYGSAIIAGIEILK